MPVLLIWNAARKKDRQKCLSYSFGMQRERRTGRNACPTYLECSSKEEQAGMPVLLILECSAKEGQAGMPVLLI
jgi:hypothetical protein